MVCLGYEEGDPRLAHPDDDEEEDDEDRLPNPPQLDRELERDPPPHLVFQIYQQNISSNLLGEASRLGKRRQKAKNNSTLIFNVFFSFFTIQFSLPHQPVLVILFLKNICSKC